MKTWILRLLFYSVIMTGIILAGLFFYDVRASAHPSNPNPIPKMVAWSLTETQETRWEGLDKPSKPMRTFRADSTAYTASEDETDSNPCEIANGTQICDWTTEKTVSAIAGMENADRLCAVNGLPFGKRIWNAEIGFCVILDRMNARYKSLSRVDVLMRTKPEAFAFGIKRNIYFTIID